MRTYTPGVWFAARAAWDDGSFGTEWSEVRRLSWNSGFPFPPAGGVTDDPEAAHPSPRAIIWRSLDDRPGPTADIVATSRSWSEVITRIIRVTTYLRAEADRRERAATARKAIETPSRGEAKSVLELLGVPQGKGVVDHAS